MNTRLTKRRIKAVLDAACDRLVGDWLLLGGSLVAVWLAPRRVTEDIDLVGLEGTAAQRLQILTLASDLGLSIEAVNSAADFFVRQIHDWRDQLVLFRRGKRCRIFRPSGTLFLLLKCRRMSEQDLQDCLKVVDRKRRGRVALNRGRILEELVTLNETASPPVRARYGRLRRVLASLGP